MQGYFSNPGLKKEQLKALGSHQGSFVRPQYPIRHGHYRGSGLQLNMHQHASLASHVLRQYNSITYKYVIKYKKPIKCKIHIIYYYIYKKRAYNNSVLMVCQRHDMLSVWSDGNLCRAVCDEVVVQTFLGWTLWGSPGMCTHTRYVHRTRTSTGPLHRARGLRV